MQSPLPHIKHFCDKKSASHAVADALASNIQEAIAKRGEARVLLSGGSTPTEAYKRLFNHNLPWENVTIIPVDDRYIPNTHTGSNFGMIKSLLTGSAAEKSVTLIDLVPKVPFSTVMLSGCKGLMTDIQPDVCLMGMGADGHTASWFPNAIGLETALSDCQNLAVTAIDATSCPGAGEYPHRISFTLKPILKSKNIILFITGMQKAGILKDALRKPVKAAPVKALFDAGSRLSVIWAA